MIVQFEIDDGIARQIGGREAIANFLAQELIANYFLACEDENNDIPDQVVFAITPVTDDLLVKPETGVGPQ